MSDSARESSSPQLWGLATSPYTAKASFALDYAGIAYDFVEHTPMLGERRLRKLAGVKKPSVPLLIGHETQVMGGMAIARWGDAQSRVQLFPAVLDEAVLAWEARSEALLDLARTLLFGRLLRSPAAQKESLPGFIPAPLRGAMCFAARQGIEFLAKKYGVSTSGGDELLPAVAEHFEALRKAVVDAGKRGTLLATFTYADVAMAVALNGFLPTDAEARTQQMGPAFRAAWTRSELTGRFPDLFAWRDRIYAQYRTR